MMPPAPFASASGSKASSGSWRLPRRLAYVVSHSLPYARNGYALRSHAVARALSSYGIEVLVINRPGRPWDLDEFRSETPFRAEQRIESIRYLFLPLPPIGAHPRSQAARQHERLTEAFRLLRPAAVMAASDWRCAAPALAAARQLYLPFFYEQRGFWDLHPELDAETAAQHRAREIQVAQAARSVFTLNQAMREELITRGVAPERIYLVPNGLSRPHQPMFESQQQTPENAGIDAGAQTAAAKPLISKMPVLELGVSKIAIPT